MVNKEDNSKSIGIIGGGYTGLTAAYLLAKLGYKVTIIEGSNELGGLASGFKIQGSYLEKTYHHLFKTDTDIINFTKELGIEDKLNWHKSSVSIYYDHKIYPFTSAIHLLNFSPLSLFARIRTGLVMFFLQKFKNWKYFQNKAASDWMLDVTGKESYKVIWEPLLKGKFHGFSNKISMAWLWARLHIRANSRKFNEGGEKLGYFEGGFNTFTQALIKKCEQYKVKVLTSTFVTNVSKKNQKIQLTTSNGKLEFDKVLATVPSHIAGKLLQNLTDKNYIEKLNSINYLGAVVGIFVSNQKISKYYWHNINDLSAPFLVFINHTNLIDKSNYKNKYIYYLGTYVPNDHTYFSQSDDEIFKKWFSYLQSIFPEFDQKRIIEKYMFKLKNAQHVVDINYASKIPDYKTPVENFYLANFSQIYPEDRGTNYSIREAKKIVEIITQD